MANNFYESRKKYFFCSSLNRIRNPNLSGNTKIREKKKHKYYM